MNLAVKTQEARRIRRKAERKYKKNNTVESRILWAEASKRADEIISHARDIYYFDQLQICSTDKKKIYTLVNQLMDRNTSKSYLPSHKPDEALASEIKEFLESKVKKIYDSIDKMTHLNTPLPYETLDFT